MHSEWTCKSVLHINRTSSMDDHQLPPPSLPREHIESRNLTFYFILVYFIPHREIFTTALLMLRWSYVKLADVIPMTKLLRPCFKTSWDLRFSYIRCSAMHTLLGYTASQGFISSLLSEPKSPQLLSGHHVSSSAVPQNLPHGNPKPRSQCRPPIQPPEQISLNKLSNCSTSHVGVSSSARPHKTWTSPPPQSTWNFILELFYFERYISHTQKVGLQIPYRWLSVGIQASEILLASIRNAMAVLLRFPLAAKRKLTVPFCRDRALKSTCRGKIQILDETFARPWIWLMANTCRPYLVIDIANLQ